MSYSDVKVKTCTMCIKKCTYKFAAYANENACECLDYFLLFCVICGLVERFK